MHHFLQSIVMGNLAKSTKILEVGGNKIIRLTLMILLRCSGGCISVPGWLLEDNLEPAGLRKTIHSAPELPGDYFEALCRMCFSPYRHFLMKRLSLERVLGRICSYHFTPVLCRIFSFEVTIVGHFSPLQESIVGSFSSMLHVHCTLCQGLYFSPIEDPSLQCYEGYLCP